MTVLTDKSENLESLNERVKLSKKKLKSIQ